MKKNLINYIKNIRSSNTSFYLNKTNIFSTINMVNKMKKVLFGLLIFFIMINVNAKTVTLTVCEKENCDSKNIDDVLTKAEDYSSFDIVNIVLKDDYKVYELELHDIGATVNIINRSDKKLDLIEINGKNNCTINLKNPFTITDKYKNDNGEFDIKNVSFTTEEFRGNKKLVEFNGNFVLKNINIDGIVKWEDYLRHLDKIDKFSHDEIYGISFNNSKVEADGLNVNGFINGIINNNSTINLKNSDISNNVYSIYNYSGDLDLDYVQTNSLIIGKNKKSNINITGTSEFLNTVKIINKEPSNYKKFKDYSNVILLNNSTYNFDLEAVKNISIDSRGVSLKRVFSVIDGIDYENIKWDSKNKDIAVIKGITLVPIGIGKTDITSQVNDNIKLTVHVIVNDKKKSFTKFIIGMVILVILINVFRKRNQDE